MKLDNNLLQRGNWFVQDIRGHSGMPHGMATYGPFPKRKRAPKISRRKRRQLLKRLDSLQKQLNTLLVEVRSK